MFKGCKPWTEPTSYEENHNITNLSLTQKSKLKSNKLIKLTFLYSIKGNVFFYVIVLLVEIAKILLLAVHANNFEKWLLFVFMHINTQLVK